MQTNFKKYLLYILMPLFVIVESSIAFATQEADHRLWDNWGEEIFSSSGYTESMNRVNFSAKNNVFVSTSRPLKIDVQLRDMSLSGSKYDSFTVWVTMGLCRIKK